MLLFRLVGCLFFHQQDFVDAIAVHFNNFQGEHTPLALLTHGGNMVKDVEYQARQGFVFALIEVFFVKVLQELVERALPTDDPTLFVGPFDDVGQLLLIGNGSHQAFKDVAEGYHPQHGSQFVTDKGMLE